MAAGVKTIPAEFHTITPYLVVPNVAEAMAFYQKALGATARFQLPLPDSKTIMHGELKIGDSIFFLGMEGPGEECKSPLTLKGSPVTLYLYVEDVQAVFDRAMASGAKEIMAVQDMFWGDRAGTLDDPFGHRWMIATHMEDLSPEETGRRAREFFASKGQRL